MPRVQTALLLTLLLLHAAAPAAPATRPAGLVAGQRLFDAHRLWTAHLHISADAWDQMQPDQFSGIRRFAIAAATTRPVSPIPPEDRRPANTFGYAHVYVHASLEFDGRTFRDVAVRFKGNSSYFLSARSLKRPFKIELNRYGGAQAIDGVTKLVLNNNALDESEIREALAYWVYGEAGVPAPRTSFALLYLTVEGRFQNQCLGLYTLVEDVDKDFLKSRFGTKKGLLLKPEGGLPYVPPGHDDAYRQYDPKTEPTPATLAGLARFSRLVHGARDEAFRAGFGDAVDLDAFLRFLAATVYVANLDSILATDHNYYFHVHPDTGRVQLIPWDLNLALGGYGRFGSGEEQMDLSIARPLPGSERLLDKTLATREFRDAYRTHLDTFTATFLAPENTRRQVAAMQRVVDEARRLSGASPHARPPLTAPSGRRLWPQPPDPATFLAGRTASIRAQLAGLDGGFVPRQRTGPISSFAHTRDPEPPAWAGRAFAALDANHDGRLTAGEFMAAVNEFFDRALASAAPASGPSTRPARADTLDNDALSAALRPLLDEPAPPIRLDFGFRNNRPLRQDSLLARAIFWQADRQLDGRLTRDEITRAARRLFREADLDGDGTLSPAEFASAVARLLQSGSGW
ncbi:MAG: CotH kinase family protein [Tepidisphaerales bacterium]